MVDVHEPIKTRCDTWCPGGVSVSESSINGQCGLIFLNPGVGNRPVITYAHVSQVDRVA